MTLPSQVLSAHPSPDARFAERGPLAPSERFPPGTSVVVLRGRARGSVAVVLDAGEGEGGLGSVTVDAELSPPEPPFGATIHATIQDRYVDARRAAAALGISTALLARITSSINVVPLNYDIGLNLRVNRSLQLPGYVRAASAESAAPAWGGGAGASTAIAGAAPSPYAGGACEYTERAVALVAAYRTAFPDVFSLLEATSAPSLPLRAFPGGGAAVLRVCTWLGQLETAKKALVPSSSAVMCPAAISAVEKAADTYGLRLRREAAAAVGKAPGEDAASVKTTRTVRVEGLQFAEVYRPETFGIAVGGVGEGEGGGAGGSINVDGPGAGG